MLMVVLELSPQLMTLKSHFGQTLNSRLKCLNVTNLLIQLINTQFILLHTLLPFNQTNVSSLDHITNKDPETLISFLLMLVSMELELSLLSISKLMIKINNGISMIETGLFITDLTQILELTLLKEKIEELFLLKLINLRVKPVSIILPTTK